MAFTIGAAAHTAVIGFCVRGAAAGAAALVAAIKFGVHAIVIAGIAALVVIPSSNSIVRECGDDVRTAVIEIVFLNAGNDRLMQRFHMILISLMDSLQKNNPAFQIFYLRGRVIVAFPQDVDIFNGNSY